MKTICFHDGMFIVFFRDVETNKYLYFIDIICKDTKFKGILMSRKEQGIGKVKVGEVYITTY